MDEGERTLTRAAASSIASGSPSSLSANLGNGAGIFRVQLKIRLGGDGALHEQRDGGVFGQRLQRRRRPRIRQRQRRHQKFMFPVHVQRGPAGYHDLEIGSDGQQLRHRGRRPNQVLEIVQQQQHGCAP